MFVSDRVIRFKCSLQNTILDVLRARGWQEIAGLASSFLWLLSSGLSFDSFYYNRLLAHKLVACRDFGLVYVAPISMV